MIARALIGAVAGAIAMFIIGFIFFATPLYQVAMGTVDNSRAAAVQQALAANLPETGTYFVPSGDTPEQTVMYGRGPIATIHYNIKGFPVADPAVMIGGFVHMLVVALLLAAMLGTVSRYVLRFSDEVRILVLGVLAVSLFARLGDSIWYHHDWTHSIYLFIADALSLIVAGLIILKLLPRAAPVPPGAAAAH